MWLIVSLILIAMLLLLVEIVLLPGVSVAGIGAVISYAIAIYKGYTDLNLHIAFSYNTSPLQPSTT